MNPTFRTEWWRPDFVPDSRERPEAVAPAGLKESGSSVPFWALMCFTFVLLISPQSHFPALAPLRIAMLCAALAMASYLFDRFVHRQPITIQSREIWLTACMVGWATLTVPFSYWPGGSVSFLLNVYFKSLVIFWLLSNTVNSARRLRQVFWALTLMAVPLAVVGAKNYFSGAFFIEEGGVKRIMGYEAPLTGNPNDLALMLNLIIPVSVALLLIHRRATARIFLLAAISLSAVAVVLTFSRGGFLTLATLLVLYLWKFRRRPEGRWALAVLSLMLVCIPLLASGYLDRLATITDIESDPTQSAQARWNDMLVAIGFVLRNPIVGSGIGQNVLALNEARGAFWKVMHNVYLEYAVELGVPGLVLFLMLLIGCIKSAMSVQRQTDQIPAFRELFYLAEGIQISLLAFTVAAPFYPVGYQFYFYYMAGLALAVRAVFETERRLCSRAG